MKLCSHCQVTYGPTAPLCALCGRDLVSADEGAQPAPNRFPEHKDSSTLVPRRRSRRRGLWLLVLSVSCIVPIGISATVDIMINSQVTWSPWVTASLSLCWTLGLSAIFFVDQPFGLFMALAFSVLSHQYFFGLVSGNPHWVFGLAWPITVGTFGLLGLSLLVQAFVGKNYHLNAALWLVFAALVNVVVDASVKVFLYGAFGISWSIIVMLALLPLALLFGVVGLAYRRSAWLRRVLHW